MAIELHPWQPSNALGWAVTVYFDDQPTTYYIAGMEMAIRELNRDDFIGIVNAETKRDNQRFRHMQFTDGAFHAIQDPEWIPVLER